MYDGAGNRVSKTEDSVTTKFLYDGARVEAEYNNSWDLVFRYTLEGDSYYDPLLSIRVASDGETHFVLPDGLGSMRNLIHSDNISSSYSYDAFGNIMSANGNPGNPYHYVGALGYYQDITSGLLHVGARYYNPKVGRFWTRDPIGYKGGLNLYLYVANSSLNWADPDGTRPIEKSKGVKFVPNKKGEGHLLEHWHVYEDKNCLGKVTVKKGELYWVEGADKIGSKVTGKVLKSAKRIGIVGFVVAGWCAVSDVKEAYAVDKAGGCKALSATKKAVCMQAGGFAGALAGAWAGAEAGAIFGPYGSLAGAVIGGVAGGCGGEAIGDLLTGGTYPKDPFGGGGVGGW